MNVRLALLLAVTALFGLLWSSDQDYQDREVAARTKTNSPAHQQPMMATNSPIVPPQNAVAVTVAPFAPSSWIAPSFATAAAEEAMREPIVAPRNEAAGTTRPVSQEPIVSAMVVFRAPRLRVDEGWIVATSQPDRAAGWPLLAANCQALARWMGQIQSEVAGQTCEVRWQMRRTASSAGRRVVALVRRQIGNETDWRVLVQKFARGEFAPFDPTATNAAPKHAAVPVSGDER